MTFAAELAASRPGETALRDERSALSWADVDERLRPAVNALLGAELGPARRVAVFAENSADTVLGYAAATLAGASAVPVNFHLTAEETAYILADSGAAAVFVDGHTAAIGAEAARLAGVAQVVGWAGADEVDGVRDWAEFTAAAGSAEPPTDAAPLPTLVYTSGTTGRPKGTELPPTSFVGGADVAEHVRRLAGAGLAGYGRHLVVGPLYHSGPLTATRLFVGGAPVTVLGRFGAESALKAIAHDRIASAIMVPTHFQRLLALPAEVRTRYDVSSLTYVLQVGAPCPADVKRAMIDWWGPVLWESYGASEVGSTCRISAADWLEHPGSVGRPVEPFEVLVVDESGEPVPVGTEGRLYFRDRSGRGIVYHRGGTPDTGLSKRLSAPGTFTLGEVGYVDEGGFVYITDRFSDMVVSGGVNIYPAEAEQILAGHPAIAEAACIGVPHPDMGEQLKALIVPTDPANPPDPVEVIAWCRDRLTHYKCPRSADIVETLPRSAMGKLDKKSLRARFAAAAV